MAGGTQTITIHMGAKVPSKVTAYKMIEASVTLQRDLTEQRDDDREREIQKLVVDARRALVPVFISICDQMGESPPDELRSDIEGMYGADQAGEIYAD